MRICRNASLDAYISKHLHPVSVHLGLGGPDNRGRLDELRGYPFGNNQFISAAGANWAILAIAQTLPDAARFEGERVSRQ